MCSKTRITLFVNHHMIRQTLFRILGFRNYLFFISRVFLRTYLWKLYLSDHEQVRFLGKLVKPNDVCIDIGANLGYFAIPLSHWVGSEGKVLAVEPVQLFREVLRRNVDRMGLGNIEVLPYALGDVDGQTVYLGTPEVAGVVRHGRTEILDGRMTDEVAFRHKAEMRRPDTLFGHLDRLNYIKCDVEGYELHIVPHLLEIMSRFKPILEIEVAELTHKKAIIGWVQPLGYQVMYLENGQLRPFQLENPTHHHHIELYFLPNP